MDHGTEKRLQEAGIDTAAGIKRTAGNEALFLRLLHKFEADPNYAGFQEKLEEGDLVQAERHLHTLKGVSANLSMTRLYPACQEADTQLKQGKRPSNLDAVQRAYDEVIGAIHDLD